MRSGNWSGLMIPHLYLLLPLQPDYLNSDMGPVSRALRQEMMTRHGIVMHTYLHIIHTFIRSYVCSKVHFSYNYHHHHHHRHHHHHHHHVSIHPPIRPTIKYLTDVAYLCIIWHMLLLLLQTITKTPVSSFFGWARVEKEREGTWDEKKWLWKVNIQNFNVKFKWFK